MKKSFQWKRLDRRIIYQSKFVTLFEDTVKLPSGIIFDDYTVIKKPDAVVVVATDYDSNVLIQKEYRYPFNKIMNNLPSGHIDGIETPLEAAKRELKEERGYTGGEFKLIGKVYEFPTKDCHTIYVVRATNVEKTLEPILDETENIEGSLISIPELKKQVKANLWETAEILAALTLSQIFE